MLQINPAPFLAALLAVLQDCPPAYALTEEELFLLANDACAPEEQLPFTDFSTYKDRLLSGQPTDDAPNAEACGKVLSLIKTQMAKHKLYMLKQVGEAGPNWRRFCWLLAQKEKTDRATNAAPRKAPAKETAPTLPQAAAPRPEAATSIPKEEPPTVEKPASPPARELQRSREVRRSRGALWYGSELSKQANTPAQPTHSPPTREELEKRNPEGYAKLMEYGKKYARHR